MQYQVAADEDNRELRRQLDEARKAVESGRQRLKSQLELAARVHRSLLPQPVHHDRIDVDVRYLPVEDVGGDYCQVRFADPGTCYITMCDVTGHGLGPALLATRVSSEVRHSILYGRAPHDIVRALNTFVVQNFGDTSLFLTFVAARIDLKSRQISWSGAGHPHPLLIRRNGEVVEELVSQNSMLGVFANCLNDKPEHTAQLEPGDRLVFYTDGLTETADAGLRYLGTKGLAEIAVDAMSVELFDAADRILQSVDDYQHGPNLDDKTLIVAEIK